MTEIPENHAEIFETLLMCLMQKADMATVGEDRRTIECPRCGGNLHLALVGARKHLRMACDGGCGMAAME